MIDANVDTSDHIMLERCPRTITLNVINVNVQNLSFLIIGRTISLNALSAYENQVKPFYNHIPVEPFIG